MAERTLILPVYVRVAGAEVQIGTVTVADGKHDVATNPMRLQLLDQVIESVRHKGGH